MVAKKKSEYKRVTLIKSYVFTASSTPRSSGKNDRVYPYQSSDQREFYALPSLYIFIVDFLLLSLLVVVVFV